MSCLNSNTPYKHTYKPINTVSCSDDPFIADERAAARNSLGKQTLFDDGCLQNDESNNLVFNQFELTEKQITFVLSSYN